ncbi:MAG TPA: hypothetical protein VI729_06515 [Anaerolineales bacterium]|nr:hypothetical protein [Anaerolineales bacterium]
MISPDNRVVDLAKLGFGSQTVILVQDSGTRQLKTISASGGFTSRELTLPEGARADGIVYTPDRKMIAFPALNSREGSGLAGYDLWVSTADGRLPDRVVSDLESGFTLRWLNDQDLALWRSFGNYFDCPGEITTINPLAGTIWTLPSVYAIPRTYRLDCFPIPFLNEDLSHGILLEEMVGWRMVDYATMTAQSVMADVDASPGGDKFHFSWEPDGMSFALPEVDRIRFADGLTEQDLLSPHTSVEVVSLPGGYEIIDNRILWWLPNSNQVGFEMRRSDDPGSVSLVIGDLGDAILRDYSLDMSLIADQRGTPWFALTSADGAFVGWAVMEEPQVYPAIGSVILNTKTGYVSYLEGVQIRGFGETEPGP